MKYRIGKLSEILNVSKDMIRYYEKMGAIAPERKEDNNYRSYDTCDALLLLGVMQYHSFGLTIKDVTKIGEDEFLDRYSRRLGKIENQLTKELEHKQLLLKRIRELKETSVLTCSNFGKYWIEESQEMSAYFLTEGKYDEFDGINEDPEVTKVIYSRENLPFMDFVGCFHEDREVWYMAVESVYRDRLHIEKECDLLLRKNCCLCTIVDLGETGSDKCDVLKSVYAYAKTHDLKVTGEAFGIYRGRCNDEMKLKRYAEVRLPIEYKKAQ